jgi:DNA-binding transcriptional regulator YiaG
MRAYADQVQQDFKCIELQPRFGLVAKAELVNLFERSPDYRFLCTLRNHVQHKATAIHGFEDAGASSDPNGWAETVKLYASKASLSADKEFKTQVLDEQPEKIDVRRRVRRSVQEMGVTHLALRGAIAEHVARARSAFELAINDYEDGGAESAVGLCARRVADPDADVPVLLNWDDVRLQLVQKNDRPPQLWPLRTHREPKTEQIVALRKEAKHTQTQAAATVFVSKVRWQDYEDGLPMPEGLYLLYQLQVGRHPTHSLQTSGAVDGQGQGHR